MRPEHLPAVLTGLRIYQRILTDGRIPNVTEIEALMFDGAPTPSPEDIDAICEELNVLEVA
jgi:hypothetical protein